ncbi:Zn-ribbon domain-containing OB-fold protein [Skermania piniformis]|uniref:OB-fold domain-containing protein n=1 Tax=Skermania pinensis TaxID=39122 RepID=A0ABX8SG36_9ACTN|nr:zinc ribbon domain-containing protein [Skermania piniformis]QXQ15919.1 OB-fold domain-containing protein [Skermania piniformis]
MIAPDISNWPAEEFRLVGGACADCGAAVFPVQALCPRCSRPSVEQLTLPPDGTLITWTTQGFLPGPPYLGGGTAQTFTPFGVGLVQLGDVVRVEGRLTENDPAKLEFGMPMVLTTIPLGVDAAGDDVLTFAFRPAGDQE